MYLTKNNKSLTWKKHMKSSAISGLFPFLTIIPVTSHNSVIVIQRPPTLIMD